MTEETNTKRYSEMEAVAVLAAITAVGPYGSGIFNPGKKKANVVVFNITRNPQFKEFRGTGFDQIRDTCSRLWGTGTLEPIGDGRYRWKQEGLD